MSLRDLDERLTALQETTTQLRELIDRLAKLDFQPGAGLPLDMDDESSVSGELSAEIGQILRNGLEEQELLTEEVQFVRPEGAEKMRLREGVERLGSELARYAHQNAILALQICGSCLLPIYMALPHFVYTSRIHNSKIICHLVAEPISEKPASPHAIT